LLQKDGSPASLLKTRRSTPRFALQTMLSGDPCNGQWHFGRLLCIGAAEQGHRDCAAWRASAKSRGGNMRKLILAAASVAALALAGPRRRSRRSSSSSATWWLRTRRRRGHRKVQGTRGEIHDGKVKVESIRIRRSTRTRKTGALQFGAVQMLAPRTPNSARSASGSSRCSIFLHSARPHHSAQSHRRTGSAPNCSSCWSEGHDASAYWDNGFKEMTATRSWSRRRITRALNSVSIAEGS